MATTSHFIAVVDDDASILRALERLLNARSRETKTFRSGYQFLESLNDELPDCLILDLHMPEMSGLDVQQALASRGIKIPIIIITANTDAALRERCMSAGAIAYLPKPVRRAELLAAIDAAGGGV
jgi:FixJ family two-component response regulator